MPRLYPQKIEMDKTINLKQYVRDVIILPLLVAQCYKLVLHYLNKTTYK